MNGVVPESLKNKVRYSKLLNNLLFIKSQDQAIFTKVNNIDSFDVTTKFGQEISKKILLEKNIFFNLNEIDLEEILEVVKTSQTAEEIIEIYENKKERLFNTKKVLLEDPNTFEATKKYLVQDLKEKIQKSKNRWIQFRRKVIDANIQDNIWVLHTATFFVSIKTPLKTIYAPLLLKEVKIEIDKTKISISSENSWKLNEKLLFILNENNFSLDEKMVLDEKNCFEIVDMIAKQLNLSIDHDNLSEKFINLKSEDIKNKLLSFHDGVVLGLFKPAGGHIRKTMLTIIENDEIDEILDPHPDKNIYKNKLNDFLQNESHNLLKIQKSNFSQNQALSSSLMQDTIIWGPPGTGKSQVIANIIANILYNNNTAVVMSQKKAALEVLKKRLGKISAFCLFILNDNKMDKEEFYQSLKTFIDLVGNAHDLEELPKKSIISKNEIESIEFISKLKNDDAYHPSLNLKKKLLKNDFALRKIFELNNNLVYPNENLEIKEYMSLLAEKNNFKISRGLFSKKYPKVIKTNSLEAIKIIDTLNNEKLNDLVVISKKTNLDNISQLAKLPEKMIYQSFSQLDEEYLLNFLANKILKKINYWAIYDTAKFKEYKKFTDAVRAARSLPYRFINKFNLIIKELFPVIITNPETSFINWEKKYFDYAIIDESSQIFLETGLPILYLAKIKIMADDPKQMQPSHWFLTRNNEIDEDEDDVVENAESLLDYALNKGTFQIMLNQNFRSSSASLMSFSAKEFYDSNLEVIDKNNQLEQENIIIENINGKWEKGVNKREVKKVIQILYDEAKKYNSIIVLAFNFHQRQLIEQEIIEKHPKLYQLLENETLSIKNIENIQGDEADLVIISVVYDATTNMSATYVCRSGGKNALNVAISRAKHKMIIVKSLNKNNIKLAHSEDFQIFRSWLEFLDMNEKNKRVYSIKSTAKLIKESHGDVDSEFERDVINAIIFNIRIRKSIKIVKQYEVGSKKIDIAFVDANNKYLLGIEVDGYKYHKGFKKYLEDFSRQEFLEFKGYQIYRIKEIDWVLRRDKILEEIKVLLEKNS